MLKGGIPPRTTFRGISKIVIVCLSANGKFLKACTAMFIVLNGQDGRSFSTFFQIFKNMNFGWFIGHFFRNRGQFMKSFFLLFFICFLSINAVKWPFSYDLTIFGKSECLGVGTLPLEPLILGL